MKEDPGTTAAQSSSVEDLKRHEITVLIGPCFDSDAEWLMERIGHYVYDTLGHPLGAAISLDAVEEEQPDPIPQDPEAGAP